MTTEADKPTWSDHREEMYFVAEDGEVLETISIAYCTNGHATVQSTGKEYLSLQHAQAAVERKHQRPLKQPT